MALANCHTDPNCPCAYCVSERDFIHGPKKRGGKREGAGRKPLPASERKIQKTVILAPETVAQLEADTRPEESLGQTIDRMVAAHSTAPSA